MSLIDLGLGAYNLYQMDDAFDDARDDVKSGFNQATQVTKDYLDPYADYGKWGMEGYQGVGEFDFDFNKYLDTDFYDWLRADQENQLRRQYSASPQGYLSGGTLVDLGRDMTNWAGTQYGAEHARQLAEHQNNQAYWGNPVNVGAETTRDMAQTLGDIAIGRGGTMAGLTIGEAEAKAKALAALMSDRAGGGGTVGGLQDLINMITGGGSGTGGTGGTGGGNPLWDGGGTDGQGDWGLIGDIGGLITGGYGDDYIADLFSSGGDLRDLAMLGNEDWMADVIGLIEDPNFDFSFEDITGIFPGLLDGDGNQYYDPLQDFFSDASPWDDPALSFDDSWWDSFTSGIGDLADSAWEGIKGLFS